MAAPWNLAPGRSIDLELGGQEVVTVEIDELDPKADDIIDVLKEGQAKVAYWTRLAGEYLQNGIGFMLGGESAYSLANAQQFYSLPILEVDRIRLRMSEDCQGLGRQFVQQCE